MLWEGTLFLVEVLAATALLITAGSVRFITPTEVSKKTTIYDTNDTYELKKAA